MLFCYTLLMVMPSLSFLAVRIEKCQQTLIFCYPFFDGVAPIQLLVVRIEKCQQTPVVLWPMMVFQVGSLSSPFGARLIFGALILETTCTIAWGIFCHSDYAFWGALVISCP